MRYVITSIVLIIFGGFLAFMPMEKLHDVFSKMPSEKAPRIGGWIVLILGIFILILEVVE